MAEKQQLNGAYYGPSIPPPQNYHRHGRGPGCGCGCCLLSCLFKILLAIVVVAGLAVLVFWLIVRPNLIKFHVTEANLTQFNFNANNTLQYNLALNITIRNPNRRIGVYYDRIEARAFYEDQRFDTITMTPFYQGHKNTSVINAVFDGQQMVLLAGEEKTEFDQETTSGVYSIDVKLYLRIRFKLGDFKTGRFKPKIECDLKVPLSSSGGGFQTTKCDFDW